MPFKILHLSVEGAPISGKTSLLDLVLGYLPRHSSAPPSLTVSSGMFLSHGSLGWERVSPERMYYKICKELMRKICNHSSVAADEPLLPPSELQLLARLLDQLPTATGSYIVLDVDVQWVCTVDCGYQPQFLDVAPLFLPSQPFRLITCKLNEKLDDKSSFHKQLTNLQLIESLAKATSTNPLLSSYPESPNVMIVGTFKDKIMECPYETIEDKNAKLQQSLKNLGVRNEDGEIIFPVNTFNPDNEFGRKKDAMKLQREITKSGGAITEDVPIRWFGLLLHLLYEAQKEDKAVFLLSDCITAGRSLKMDTEETLKALLFFHNHNVLMHFPNTKLDKYVFVDITPVLENLSLLLGVSFFDKDMLKKIFPRNLPRSYRDLKDYGCFRKKMLENHFVFSGLLTAGVLLSLMEHLMLVAPIERLQAREFFLPSALSYASELDISKLQKRLHDPWIVRLNSVFDVHVPIPNGLFPILAVHLLLSSSFSTEKGSLQYRNALCFSYAKGGHVYIIEGHLQLEVYFSRAEYLPEECPVIRDAILKSMSVAEKQLHIPFGSITKHDAFLCTCIKGPSRHICVYYHHSQLAQCEKTGRPCELKLQQTQWLHLGEFISLIEMHEMLSHIVIIIIKTLLLLNVACHYTVSVHAQELPKKSYEFSSTSGSTRS